MKRFFSDYLTERHSKKNKKPLIVNGARQVGKTYVIEEFARQNFDDYIKINFEETPELKEYFKTNDVIEIKQNLEVYFGKKIIPGKTLLFIDEIQACPEAIVTLRYFYEKLPGIDVITAGSLLDHTLNNLKYSMPVGRVEFAYLTPMNFYEFLSALSETAILDFLKNYKLEKEIPLPLHQKILKILRLYFFIGGMPQAVKAYLENNSLKDVEIVHESILKSLQYDFAKYGTRSQQEVLIGLLKYLPNSIGKKFKYTNAIPEMRVENTKRALELLKLSRIVNIVYSTDANGIPLESEINQKVFKPIFLDIGLANHLLKLRLQKIEDLITVNEGNLAEQFIGQQLLSLEPFYLEKQIYYWAREKRNSSAEIDFVTEYNGMIIPIEVKAGKTGTLKSLHIFMKEKKMKYALRFNTDIALTTQVNNEMKIGNNVTEIEYKLISLPLYLILEHQRIFENRENV
ncbi:MAG: ATP-binding protein [Ignavibacteriae bacterium]|nr:DUF4143 domain-containing protein [Ignavibacteriota bacterium]NOG99726.1 ATP-binding protein [Ignavibacteriota bacterium]